ncbi:hypothetical protein ACIQV3_19745 [Streptomyces sp. NPDC099050]|uniref:hypothetical protein n=1 Tax=Streptomyces sp. NPDC099050 TaxID=3366100 RepID=UPI00381E501B
MAIQGSLRVLAISVTAVSAIGVGGAIWLATDLSGWGGPGGGPANRAEVPCAQALAFARGSLPAGAREGQCERLDWLDTEMRGSFRMERDAVDAWLAGTFPPGTAGTSCPAGQGAQVPPAAWCRSVDYAEPVAGSARYLKIRVIPEAGASEAAAAAASPAASPVTSPVTVLVGFEASDVRGAPERS